MKKTNTCPKCSSNDIVRIPGRHHDNAIVPGMTTLSAITVTRFLCSECGFSEEYVDNKSDIAQLKKIFGR